LLLRHYQAILGWIPTVVASQKIGSDAGDMPRFARQHTFRPEKEPENNGLGFWLSPVRSPLGSKKPSSSSHPRQPPAARLSNRLDSDPDSGPDSGVHHGIRFAIR
jgi:hypothetical protein